MPQLTKAEILKTLNLADLDELEDRRLPNGVTDRPTWFNLARNGSDAVVDVFGFIGWSVSARGFAESLAELGDVNRIEVRINSEGGFVSDGLAIYNMLRQHQATVSVNIIGMAASMASVIAMAADEGELGICESASIMIHNAWGLAIGDHNDMRKGADLLERTTSALATVYARRTGQAPAEILQMLNDETWFFGKEAVDAGFADSVDEDEEEATEAAAAFDMSRFKHGNVINSARTEAGGGRRYPNSEESPMPEENAAANGSGQADLLPASDPAPQNSNPSPDGAPATPAAGAPADPAALQAQGAATERARVNKIHARFANCPHLNDIRDQAVTEGWSYEMALEAIANNIDRDAEPLGSPVTGQGGGGNPNTRAEVTRDGRDKAREGMTAWLMAKGFPDNSDYQNALDGNEFRGMSLMELCRASLTAGGENAAGLGTRAMVLAAITHTGGDFPLVVENIAHKAVMKGWDEYEQTYGAWTNTVSLTDFKPLKQIGLSAFSALDETPDGKEIRIGTLSDYGETIQLATYTKAFSIGRQAIINDDISAFTSIPRAMGQAARRVPADLVYGVLIGNPTLSDGVAMFDATHNNIAAVGGPPNVSTLSAGRTAMALQKDPSGETTWRARPRYALVPEALYDQALMYFNVSADPSSTSRSEGSNTVRGLAEPISDPRLDADSSARWYLAADPALGDTISVGFLDGREEPVVETMDAWTALGLQMRVHLDTAAAAMDFRGVHRNNGS